MELNRTGMLQRTLSIYNNANAGPRFVMRCLLLAPIFALGWAVMWIWERR